MSKMASERLRVGIVGYGGLGRYLTEEVLKRVDEFELAFVWNRSEAAFDDASCQLKKEHILRDLSQFPDRQADLIVEVAHPSIVSQWGEAFLKEADFLASSPTAMADPDTNRRLRDAATMHGLYIPSGAMWGLMDIRKMADRGTLTGLKITMKKHPKSFKLIGNLAEKNALVTEKETVLYDGPVRDLCPLAPRNVNTMAAAAIAAHNLGFGEVCGSLVANPSLDCHITQIDVYGPRDSSSGEQFHVRTTRSNPAPIGRLTGSGTYASLLSSMLAARGKGKGVHLC
ncbi:aspartate dehydrogenase domain-containing protein-like [Oscarella lobularis]|uniref:aspartate dehydrogenase domain-containing protein-like n=1 Tax=Oscarella lobularis TaxID=121494 RepID=UPI00331393E3